MDNLQIIIYKDVFVELKTITRDGNLLFKTLLFHLYNKENSHKNLLETSYKCVSNNINKFYEFCYVENDTYYIDIKEGIHIKKYISDEYVEKIRKYKFLPGSIEINLISIILNRPILILAGIYYEEKKFYKKLILFNNIELRMPILN